MLLEWAFDYVEQGLVGSLRVSTRPDAVSREDLERLKQYGVRTIELGFQALDDRVLRETLRGHGVGDNLKALALVKEQGLTAGVQLMPGLPGDRPERFLSSLALLTARAPDFVRLYPVLVFKGTALARRYLEGILPAPGAGGGPGGLLPGRDRAGVFGNTGPAPRTAGFGGR